MSNDSIRNILLLLVDQWPHNFFGRLGMPMPTPHTDRLASEGTVFNNAFTTCPLCSPARGTLLTARWPHQIGMIDNPGGGYSLQTPLDTEERTWVDGAVDAGYRVGYYGKWHLGTDGPIYRGVHGHSRQFEPRADVYDPKTSSYSYAWQEARYAEDRQHLHSGRPPFFGRARQREEENASFRLADEVCSFLRDAARDSSGKPFFLTASFWGPHFPHYLPDRFADLAERMDVPLPANLHDDFNGKPTHHGQPWWPSMDTAKLSETDWRTVIAYSLAHSTLVDEAIGRILTCLQEAGKADDTVVLFASDHGDMCGAHNRFDKGAYFYEEVWRIPLTIRWPGRSPARQAAYVSLIDVGRTLFDLAGIPARPERPLSGRDLRSLVGAAAFDRTSWPARAYGVYDLYNGMSFAVRAIRDERCKYVWNPQAVDEVYDLKEDPHELRNLCGRPEVAERERALRGELQAWLRERDDPILRSTGALFEAGTVLVSGRRGP